MRSTSRWVAACVAAVALAGCGSDNEPAADEPTAPAAESRVADTTPEPAPDPEPKRAGPEDCGDAEPGTDGGDQPTKIKATGIDCGDAVKVAAKVQAAMAPVDGWDCPAIGEYGQADQKCTKDGATVSWTVKWL